MSKSTLFKLIRTVVGFAMAFFLIRYVVVSNGVDLKQVWALVDSRFLAVAFVLYGCGFFLAAVRWYLLLRYIQVFLPLVVVVRLAMIGQFFNLFVPGGVGGDLIKMVYLRKEAGDRYPEALLTVLLDRLLGLAGLLLVGLMAVALNPSVIFHSSREMRAILAVVILAGTAGLVGAVLFVAWQLAQSTGLIGLAQRRFGAKTGLVTGLVLGFTSFVSHAGGPPAAVFLLGRKLDKTRYQATTVIVFWVINLFKFVPYSFLGIFTIQTLIADLLLAPAALIGAWLGVKAHHMIPERAFFAVTYVLLSCTGVKLIWDALA